VRKTDGALHERLRKNPFTKRVHLVTIFCHCPVDFEPGGPVKIP